LEYLILPEVYRQELCKGFDSTEVSKALVERSYLVIEAGDKYSVRRTLLEIGRKRVYSIRAAILEDA
jgi:putative DNA primase/helicase